MIKQIIFLFFCVSLSYNLVAQERDYINLQRDWKFKLGETASAALPEFDDSAWEAVDIPHDWAISGPFELDGNGSTAKLPWKGVGWYRKEFNISEEAKGKRVHIIFDGVMAFPEVYINGQLVGKWDYGYNSFYFDITDFLNVDGSNLLAVKADTRQHDSRWYPGAGIYRKVRLLVTNPVHVEIWGNHVHTPIIKPHYAEVTISSSVKNSSNSDQNVTVIQSVYSPNNNKLSEDTISYELGANTSKKFERTLAVHDPSLWSIENPTLYSAKSTVYVNGEVSDELSTSFGIRSIRFTADDGFYLNDKRVQLRGVNLHHGHGPLGAAFYPRAMERQLQIMKDMGVNAIRNSHNVAAPELLEMCDKMGLLFFNEVFDKYDAKADILDTTNFEGFAHRNIRNFVMRDRNHPSVFLWSVGNEIGDVQWNINNGFDRLHTMVNYVKKYDPFRPVTLVNDQMESAKLRHFRYYDVHSWNYGQRYRIARKLEPDMSVVISESASTLSTRGFYEFPLPDKKTDFTKSLQVSSYDLNAPWWAEIADDDFMWQQDEAYIAGEFVWTGFDYLGEPTPYDNQSVKEMGMTDKEASRSSYFGAVDLVGLPKDRFYLYKSYWVPNVNTIHMLPHWNWPERVGKNVPVFVYTNGDEAELFLNDKSLGKRAKNPMSENSTERFRLMWKNVTYEPGTLKVIAYKNGVKIGEETLSTTKEVSQLKLTVDRKTITADGLDLAYVTVEGLDENGNTHPLAMNRVKLKLTGNAEIAGVGNGNPQSFEPFQANYVDLFYGKAVVIIKSRYKSGKAKLTASAEGLKSDSVTIQIE